MLLPEGMNLGFFLRVCIVFIANDNDVAVIVIADRFFLMPLNVETTK